MSVKMNAYAHLRFQPCEGFFWIHLETLINQAGRESRSLQTECGKSSYAQLANSTYNTNNEEIIVNSLFCHS